MSFHLLWLEILSPGKILELVFSRGALVEAEVRTARTPRDGRERGGRREEWEEQEEGRGGREGGVGERKTSLHSEHVLGWCHPLPTFQAASWFRNSVASSTQCTAYAAFRAGGPSFPRPISTNHGLCPLTVHFELLQVRAGNFWKQLLHFSKRERPGNWRDRW